MNNIEVAERIDQMNGAQIDKLLWIAAMLESSELTDFLTEELDNVDWEKMIPGITNIQYFQDFYDDGEMTELLIDENKLGFIAKVTFPRLYNFNYDEKGNVKGCSIHPGIRRIHYVYTETPEKILDIIEKISAEQFKEYQEEDKRNKETQTSKS